MMVIEYKHLIWLENKIETPPFSKQARMEAGFLLRKLQMGDKLTLPHSRPMPSIGKRCHELRVNDKDVTWRIIYRIDHDAVILLEVFTKKTDKTPPHIITTCKERIKLYDSE